MWHFDTDFTDFVKKGRNITKISHMLSFQALTSRTLRLILAKNQPGWSFSSFKMSGLNSLVYWAF